jgi:hypothetical protein
MGNCAASRFVGGGGGGDGGDPVAVCRDRKRLIKAAAERRFALAGAHANYAAALRSVADALDVFVARHTAPAPILITLPTPSNSPPGSPKASQVPVQELPSPATPSPAPPPLEEEATPASPPAAEDGGGGAQTLEIGIPYYYPPLATPPPPPPAASVVGGWDFFNPFYGTEEVAAVISDEEMRAVREREGIPELEEAEEEDDGSKAVEAKAPKTESSLGVSTPQEEAKDVCEMEANSSDMEVALAPQGRELLAALKEVEELFARAAEAGKEVSGMLEAATRVPELKGPAFTALHCFSSSDFALLVATCSICATNVAPAWSNPFCCFWKS